MNMINLVINKQFQQNVIEMVPDQQLLNKLMPGSDNTDEIQEKEKFNRDYVELLRKEQKEKTEQFKQDFRKFQEEIERIQKVHQIEIEEKNRLIEQGNQLYQALSEKYEQAIKLKDQEMQEFLEFKYKPLENKVEMLKEENMVSENKVNVKTQDDFKKQQEEVKKMQIFIMSQKQELDHLRKTVQETDNMKRTNQFQISMSQGDQIKNENHTYLLEQIDLLRQELNIERQKNNQMLGQQQILLPNLKQSNNYTSPANQGSQQQAEYIQKLQEEIEALKLINMNYKPIVQKVPKGQGNKLQQLKSIDEVQETNQLRKQLKGMNQKQPIDLDKKQVQEQKNQNEDEFENFDEESCIQSVKSVSMPQNQLTNTRQFVKDDKLPENQTKSLQDDSILSFEDNVDREECVKQNLLLRQYVNKLVQQNYEYQQNIGKGALSGQEGEINNLLQEKMQALINKVKELKEENRLLNEALDDKFQGEGFQNSLQDSSNVSLAKLRNENKKLKAYIQLKGNQGEDEKLKAMKYDFLEEQIDQLQIENRKLKAEINGTASKAGNYGALNQLRDVENRNAQLQENNIKLSEALRVKMQENEQLKAQGMYLSRHAKENIFNMERSFRDNYQQIERSYKENMQKHQQVNQELEKVTNVLRGKMKESDELKAAIQQFDNLMRQKNVQNEQLAQKCQQLAQALQQRVQNEQQANEVFKQNQILRQDMEKITNALKDKLRENENIKQNFKKLEQFIRERDLLEAELRKMKDIVELKLRENGEIRNRCQQMEGRIRQTQEIEGKMRDLQSKMRFVLTEIQSIPQKIGGLGQSQFY
ncbi:hypothetical protein PPERSA_13041 [Pseudocohnilembus persalinus]|uniref:Uncharacterized protein n=1 Tax=Pseudocohnilembus persalinus TaxID=266149 RepID=A0A0V0R2Q4_PSEPJ|nr:hypothetical protein PPERSA_13041 [Pseudocohnilembus persalinus]|eukprot:KRX08560.1 hypothetical protein PPERSA_13041 [Pseudocohnilembus persalinus]